MAKHQWEGFDEERGPQPVARNKVICPACGKRTFASQGAARRHLRDVQLRLAKAKMHPYWCDVVKGWHVGHLERRRK